MLSVHNVPTMMREMLKIHQATLLMLHMRPTIQFHITVFKTSGDEGHWNAGLGIQSEFSLHRAEVTNSNIFSSCCSDEYNVQHSC